MKGSGSLHLSHRLLLVINFHQISANQIAFLCLSFLNKILDTSFLTNVLMNHCRTYLVQISETFNQAYLIYLKSFTNICLKLLLKPNLCPNTMENEIHDRMDLALHDNRQEVHIKSNETLVYSEH